MALLGVSLVAGLAVQSNRINIDALGQLYEEDTGTLVHLMRMENSLLEVRFRTAGVLLDQLPIPGSLNHLKEVRQSLSQGWQALSPLAAKVFTEEQAQASLKELAENWPIIDATLAKLEAAYTAKDKDALGSLLEEEWPLMHKKAVKPLQALIPLAQKKSETVYLEAQTKSRKLVTAGLLGGFLCVLGLAVLAWYTMRAVLRPLAEVELSMGSIAAGDLAASLPEARTDELGRMIEGLSSMQAHLHHVVSEVRHATDSISTASTEIATGTLDLSHRTEESASNLQQASAQMETLTQVVRQSADAAKQANKMATAATEVALRGGIVVGRVVATMEDISTSSRKISDIIGVIDGIAFQTNILALNAAVEAARAGEQGRGFAVVATEVRSLAGRSAQAAREIKSLIGASVEKVESGTRLVADAGSTMQELVGSVKRVTDIIGEITLASTEQSDGINSMNGSISQLDHMTQQNAALVEQSAAAAESLQDQAAKLAQVISGFKLN
ncbi:MAG: HAMP domain-containing protein [Paucibacter sp.]|nr:HAMP domain-containing protein [Roseateles sp.]